MIFLFDFFYYEVNSKRMSYLNIRSLDQLITTLKALVEPEGGYNVDFDPLIEISARYMPRVLDKYMVSHFIELLEANRQNGVFDSVTFPKAVLDLAYKYAEAKRNCSYQFVPQGRGIWRVRNGTVVREVPLYEIRTQSSRWVINSPKFINNVYHTSIHTMPLMEQNDQLHRQKVENLNRITVSDQRQSYLIHVLMTGENEVLQPRANRPFLWEEGDPERVYYTPPTLRQLVVNPRTPAPQIGII